MKKRGGPSSEVNVSKADVLRVAGLARLRITEAEADSFQRELNSVLKHFETLQNLSTKNVRSMSHVPEMQNIWREDKPRESGVQEPILSNAPDREDDLFKVPRILGG